MHFWVFSFFLLTNIAFAEVGKISKIVTGDDAFLRRGSEKIILTSDTLLEVGDELHSQQSVILIHIYPTTQLSMAKNTQIKITKSLIEETHEKDKSFSIISFIKGIVRVQVVKDDNLEVDQKIEADGVAFAVRGTEFEVSKEHEDFELDVSEGEVEVSSPFIQTFVPEIVKANEGFKFNKKARKFERRKFKQKFKNAPKFADKQELRQKWKEKRRLKKTERRLKRKKKAKS